MFPTSWGCTLRIRHVGGHVSLVAGNSYELQSHSFIHISLGILRAIPGYDRLGDKNVLAGVIAADGAVAASSL